MDTNGLAHAFGLQSRREAEAWKRMNWDDDERDSEAVWPAYLFVLLCCAGILWYVYDLRWGAQ